LLTVMFLQILLLVSTDGDELNLGFTPWRPYNNVYEISANKKTKTTETGVVCACAKCGCTSFFRTLYHITFGYNWEYQNAPFVMQPSARWKGALRKVKSPKNSNAPFSLAVYRDPKERIISSWKSKIACEEGYKTDRREARMLTRHLLRLSGQNSHKKCLDFDEYLSALKIIHQKEKEANLERHFLPQYLGCFRHASPNDWNVVVPMKDERLSCILAQGLGLDSCNVENEHTHTSGQKSLNITKDQNETLNFITAKEYIFFEYYGIF